MIHLHSPRERAAGSDFRADGPVKVPAQFAPPHDPMNAPCRKHRGVRFCAEGGFHV